MIDAIQDYRYSKIMTENIEKIVEENLHLTGAKKDKFVREAKALRNNLLLRKKQKDSKKCTNFK